MNIEFLISQNEPGSNVIHFGQILQARKVRLAQFKQELQELLVSYSNVIPLTSFVTTYKQLYQKDLNVRDFGVYNLYALLQKVTDVALLKMRCRESVAQMCLVAV